MKSPIPNEPANSIPPDCGPTLARLQLAIDHRSVGGELTSDPHAANCPDCRDRILAAKTLLAGLVQPCVYTAPGGLTESILAGVRADRRARNRRVFAMTGGLAAAAAILIVVWVGFPPATEPVPTAKVAAHTPTTTKPDLPLAAPEPKVTLNDRFAYAEATIREQSRAIVSPAATAPGAMSVIADSIGAASPFEVSADLEPTRETLTSMSGAAETGLRPVTGSAKKAFARLLRDISAIQPRKPTS